MVETEKQGVQHVSPSYGPSGTGRKTHLRRSVSESALREVWRAHLELRQKSPAHLQQPHFDSAECAGAGKSRSERPAERTSLPRELQRITSLNFYGEPHSSSPPTHGGHRVILSEAKNLRDPSPAAQDDIRTGRQRWEEKKKKQIDRKEKLNAVPRSSHVGTVHGVLVG